MKKGWRFIMKRGLPIGTEDFGEIIEQGSFYVDKKAKVKLG